MSACVHATKNITVNVQIKRIKDRDLNPMPTFPTPLPFSPATIVLSCKNGEEIARLEIATNRKDAILNQVSWKIVREGLA